MMLRKRAWDMMRDDFAVIRDDANLAVAVRTMRESMSESPENTALIVTNKAGKLVGVVSIWSILKALEKSVLKDENLKNVGETDWDQAFRNACLVCTQVRLDDYVERDVQVVRPSDPVLVVLEHFLRRKRHWAVVTEGSRIMGIITISDLYREMTRDMIHIF